MNPDDRAVLVRGAEKYLDSLGTTLYGQAWDITNSPRRHQCAEQMVDEAINILKASVVEHYMIMLDDVVISRGSDREPTTTYIAPKNRVEGGSNGRHGDGR